MGIINQPKDPYFYFAKASEIWGAADSQTNPQQKRSLLETARGQFNLSLQYGAADESSLVGAIARFHYGYAAFLSQELRDYGKAQEMSDLASKYANLALQMDERDFNAHMVKVLVAGDGYYYETTLKRGGIVGAGVSFFKKRNSREAYCDCVSDLIESYVIKAESTMCAIDSVIAMTEEVWLIAEQCEDLGIDATPVFNVILEVNEDKIEGGDLDEDALKAAVEKYLNLRLQAEGRVSLSK